jgi:Lar family restriction alleviation protein
MNETVRLEPCPFCSEREALLYCHDEAGDHWIWCMVETCEVSGPVRKSKDEAIAAWNQRAPHPAHEPMLSALEEAVEWDSYDEWGEPAVWLEKALTAIALARRTS